VKSKRVCLAMLVFLALVLVKAGSAQELQPLEPAWLRQMYSEGWQKVEEGVLRRDLGEGRTEAFSYGAEGFRWLIQKYSEQLAYFEGEYRESPSDELASLVNRLRDRINALQDEALTAPAADSFDAADTLQTEDCTSYSLTADAGFKTSTQGVEASASASFSSTCEITGSTFASAWAKAAVGTVVTDQEQHDPKDNGTQLLSQAYASVNGSLECESVAMASVTFLGTTYSAEDRNTDCPDIVSIAGPTQVATDYYGQACADVTWTVTTASGRTDYTFEWYIGTSLEGTGTTLTKRYCNEATSVTPRVVASDGAGWSGEAEFTTNIQYTPPVVASVTGPATVTIDYYSSNCATVTWTASATGGHSGSGYTYNWYIGTGTTVQGTGNAFSKQFCSSSQLVTVKAVAQDSDGHTDDATYVTDIQYIGPVASSISGPASVSTDYYGPTCVNATWTANAAGGHPGYTYSWYLGTSTGTTVQGTGSTFTKSLCSTDQSVTVKVVDSDAHSATKTFTTNVQYKPAIVANITGPTSVSSSTSCTTVSWTASASSTGHSGFSYKWYIGTTLQSTTSTTFSKQFCSSGGSSQSVTVKATATASDGHQDSDTHTTTITFTPPPSPPTASISGPASVQLATSTECKSLTWTAGATGGTPGYTYSWYIGTSTTVQGTATTLTKSYCGPQTINVKLVVRDSAAQTDDATFTTKLSPPPSPLAASISGPSSIALLSAGECQSITWTGSATGGTSGYSYSWYIGTSTTVQGTSSTLTKTFCGSQTINVKLTVRDSAAQSATATFATKLSYQSPIICSKTECVE
jgi:hypothetical protein